MRCWRRAVPPRQVSLVAINCLDYWAIVARCVCIVAVFSCSAIIGGLLAKPCKTHLFLQDLTLGADGAARAALTGRVGCPTGNEVVRDILYYIAITAIYVLSEKVMAFATGQTLHKKLSSDATEKLRKHFQAIALPRGHAINGHAHGYAASQRNAAESLVHTIASTTPYRPMALQPSARQVAMFGKTPDYILRYHWPRDAHSPEHEADIHSDHCFAMVNVDYYCDINEIASLGLPIVGYTFQPIQPAGVAPSGEFSWSIENGQMRMSVNGGNTYTHQLWDFSTDTFTVAMARSWWEPDRKYAITYRVDRRRVDDCFILFLLTPISLTRNHGPTSPLQRLPMSKIGLNCEKGPVKSTIWRYPNGDVYVTGEGINASAFLNAGAYASVVARMARGALRPSDIPGHLQAIEGLTKDATHYSIIGSYLTTDIHAELRTQPFRGAQQRLEVWVPVDHLERKAGAFEEVKQFQSPIGAAYIVTASPAAAALAYQTRVVEVNTGLSVFPLSIVKYQAEFIAAVVAVVGLLEPRTATEVMEAQDKPRQKLRSEQAKEVLGYTPFWQKMRLSSFNKKEATAEPKDPRIISQPPTPYAIEMSRYTHPVSSAFKALPWYAFGMDPLAVANRVKHLSMNASTVCETDFSRFDGTQTWAHWGFKRELLLALYHTRHHAQLRHLCALEANADTVTKDGQRFPSHGQMNSGSPLTSIMNTALNAFIAYCTKRDMGLDADAAWKGLGLYGGDDGLTWDISAIRYNEVSEKCGLRLKATARDAGLPVNFLGRVYLNPKETLGNMADPNRCLVKFNVKCDINTPLDVWVANKATGYLVTDPATPVLSEYCKALLRCSGAKADGGDGTPDGTAFYGAGTHWGVKQLAAYPPEMIPAREAALAYYGLALQTDVSILEKYEEVCRRANQYAELPTSLTPGAPPVAPKGMAVGDQPAAPKTNRTSDSSSCSPQPQAPTASGSTQSQPQTSPSVPSASRPSPTGPQGTGIGPNLAPIRVSKRPGPPQGAGMVTSSHSGTQATSTTTKPSQRPAPPGRSSSSSGASAVSTSASSASSSSTAVSATAPLSMVTFQQLTGSSSSSQTIGLTLPACAFATSVPADIASTLGRLLSGCLPDGTVLLSESHSYLFSGGRVLATARLSGSAQAAAAAVSPAPAAASSGHEPP